MSQTQGPPNVHRSPSTASDAELREQALARLREKRDFHIHLAIYVTVNLLLVALWAWVSSDDFFWPLFSLVGWGIGLVAHALSVYGTRGFSEERVRREMDRLRGSS